MKIICSLAIVSILLLTWFSVRMNNRVAKSRQPAVHDPNGLTRVRDQLRKIYQFTDSGELRILLERAMILTDTELRFGQTDDEMKRKNLAEVDEDNDLLGETCHEKRTAIEEDDWFLNYEYQMKNCPHKPVHDLVTILLYAETCKHALKLWDSVRRVYPNVPVRFAVRSVRCSYLPWVKLFNVSNSGSTWFSLASSSKTKYVLIGRNLVHFTLHNNLDRMIRIMNTVPNIKAVGGSIRREPDGHWLLGCHQLTLLNFSLHIQPGYDYSDHSCAFCDYLESPFLIRRSDFLHWVPDAETTGEISFVDFFLTLAYKIPPISGTMNSRSVACVDLMFAVKSNDRKYREIAQIPRENWISIAKLWSVDHIILPEGVEHRMKCTESGMNCARLSKLTGVLPSCCMNDLLHCVIGFLQLAEQHNITTVIMHSSALAPIKFHSGFLSSDVNYLDIGWDITKDHLIDSVIRQLLITKYKCRLGNRKMSLFTPSNYSMCSSKQFDACPKYPLRSSYWLINLYGIPVNELTLPQGLISPTKINFHGIWVITDINPGKVLRNRLGDDALRTGPKAFTSGDLNRTEEENFHSQESSCFPIIRGSDCFKMYYLEEGFLQFQV
ncbi:hypothetical protein D915_003937 [Fasciola hepatica]|uniref:Uncharacterized protein n=1 Tax=Fasciola hepatica TaxID=6192 RepID=A0A4E0S087_FASHE|nr:hypothetical protein D915_003937 [Fasciola hepatica]